MIREIITHFDESSTLPVSVNEVRDLVKRVGPDDEITFHFVEMDSKKVRGIVHRYVSRPGVYAEPLNYAEVCIAKDQPLHWQRLVAVKEMLHVIDCDAMTASSKESVDKLFYALSLPPEIRPDEIKKSFVNDKTRIYLALAILVPKRFRVVFKKMVSGNLITHLDIARMSGVPARFVPAILDENFEESIEHLIRWEESENGQ